MLVLGDVQDHVGGIALAHLLVDGEARLHQPALRALARRDVERARDFAAAQNHDLLHDEEPSRTPFSSISVPTLVVHGSADPMFPIGHGEALAEEIPGARLLRLDGAGHGVERADWEAIVQAILEHT